MPRRATTASIWWTNYPEVPTQQLMPDDPRATRFRFDSADGERHTEGPGESVAWPPDLTAYAQFKRAVFNPFAEDDQEPIPWRRAATPLRVLPASATTTSSLPSSDYTSSPWPIARSALLAGLNMSSVSYGTNIYQGQDDAVTNVGVADTHDEQYDEGLRRHSVDEEPLEVVPLMRRENRPRQRVERREAHQHLKLLKLLSRRASLRAETRKRFSGEAGRPALLPPSTHYSLCEEEEMPSAQMQNALALDLGPRVM
ncbi:hypothetical protein OE88DRAFT_1660217 [Heliocybe sulcata]|uniref:Uncharacterized protein n=1 Tax=Heliocybe sulcata TaxID=5364 RepID=A0A5C3MZV9_9AGAM|nr:hypothetical protein OE88DRAFT_1660217 [Heliocybe sulcata]